MQISKIPAVANSAEAGRLRFGSCFRLLDLLVCAARIIDMKVKGEIISLLCAIKSDPNPPEEMLDRLTGIFRMPAWESLAGLGTAGARTENSAVVNVHILAMQ